MTKTIDFANLTLRDALDLAILVEEEAMERYEEFVDQMELHHSPEPAEFFRVMVFNEAKHRDQLLARRRALFADEDCHMTRSMLWDVEAPDYDSARAFMSARQAMEVALQCEIKAHDYFDQALKHISDTDVRVLFEELREEEVEHQEMVKKAMAKLPPDSGIRPDDYEDEPVAH